jgi:hypothetical protein
MEKKLGPLPVWAYVAVGGGLVMALYLKGHPLKFGTSPAQVGAPGGGTGLGTGVAPQMQLETSPPGSPQPPGRVTSSSFVPHFAPTHGYTPGYVSGPAPQVGGVIRYADGVILPAVNSGGGFSTFNQSDLGYQSYKFGEQNPLYTGLSSGWTPDAGYQSFISGERSTAAMSPFANFSDFGPTSGALPAFNPDIGPGGASNLVSQSIWSGPSLYSPPSSFLDLSGYQAPPTYAAGSSAQSTSISYAASPSIQSDIASSTSSYSSGGSTYSGPNTDVGPSNQGAGTSNVF